MGLVLFDCNKLITINNSNDPVKEASKMRPPLQEHFQATLRSSWTL